jgi:hypothetical protein
VGGYCVVGHAAAERHPHMLAAPHPEEHFTYGLRLLVEGIRGRIRQL